MTENTTEVDLEREKTESFELGRLSRLEDIADDLRERAGELYAQNDDRRSRTKAGQLKSLAQDFEEKAADEREQWDEKYE